MLLPKAQDRALVPSVGATVTVVTNKEGRLTKRVELRNNKLDITPAGKLYSGSYETIPAPTPTALADIIRRLTDQQAFLHGVAINGSAAGTLATKTAIEQHRASTGALSRTLDCFEFPNGRPGILPLDLDFKDDAPGHLIPQSLDDARERLIAAEPALSTAPMLAIPSASANIFKAGTDVRLRGLTGIRVYVWVANAADIPEIGQRLNDRMLLSGAGYAHVTAPGAIQVLTVLDMSVWSPERLDFAAGASCGDGIEQRRDMRVWNDVE